MLRRLRAMASSQTPSLLSKFQGALVGAVVGDCIGAHFEMSETVSVEEVVRLCETLKKKSKNKHPFTDDTAMARSVADSLIHCKSLNTKDMAQRFTKAYLDEPGRGYGANVGMVFQQLNLEECKEPFGPASRQFGGQGSYGNGGAMRIAPAALFGVNHNENELNKLAEDITLITHCHRDAIRGAILQCAAVQLALRSPPNETEVNTSQMIDSLLQRMDKLEAQDALAEGSKRPPPRRVKRLVTILNENKKRKKCIMHTAGKSEEDPKPYCFKLQKMKDFLDADTPTCEVVETLGTDISALAAAPAALYSFLRCTKPVGDIKTDNPLERTIVYAISLGGDTDTIATMAGAIAGAQYGIERVPEHWRANCEGVKDAMKQAKLLHDMCDKAGVTSHV